MEKENSFQSKLKKELKERYPGCIVTKLDSSDIQGIPDLLVLYKNKWATLENKRSKNAKKDLIKNIMFKLWMICLSLDLYIQRTKNKCYLNSIIYLGDRIRKETNGYK